MWNIIFLLIIFSLKKVIDSKEIRLFKLLIIINCLEYFIEIPLQIIVRKYGIEASLVDIFSKLYLIIIFTWFSVFSIYTFTICLKDDSNKKKESIIRICHYFSYAMGVLFLFVVPFSKFHEGDIMYIYGGAVDVLKLLLGIYMAIWFVLLVSNIRRIINKRYLPIFLILLLGGVNIVVQTNYPSVLITSMIGTFICFIMSFTIENPDVKLVEYERTEVERAEAASLAKSEFLSSMSHELRTPLNAIVGLSEDIESYMEEVPEEVKEDTKDIINASNTLLELIGSILDISKIESGKLDIIDSDYDPKEEFESLAKIMRTKFNEKRLEFKVSLADNIPEVLFGDRLRIKQIINNLLSNACKYTDNGNVLFQVNWLAASGSLQIIVKDTGRGVKPEDIDKLFAKYDRLGVEKTSSVQGTGLGLPITKTLIDLMGGTITVDSTYLVGTTFTVILPQKFGSKERLEELRRENESAPSRTDYSGMKLLVVDDNMLNIKVLKKAIKSLNFEVDECYNGKEALDKIEVNNNYDIVLLDILMPVMNGEETIKNLRLKPNFKTPVIALTADAMTGAKEKYQAMGFDDYIAKPFTRDAIAKKLASVLGDEKKETQHEVNTEVQPDIKTNTQQVANAEVKTEVNEETK